jgi:hypothetical protein
VTITSTAPPLLTGESYTLTWTGDADEYLVRYSKDNGATWMNLSIPLSGNSYQVDLTTLAGTLNAHSIFEVIASNGLQSVSAQLSGFTVTNKAPFVTIFTPAEGDPPREVLTLSGAAFDLEDGWLTPGQLTWISDQDGVLGTGSALNVYLSAGIHHVTLQVIDSQGRVGGEKRAINGWKIFLPNIFSP